MRNLPQLLSLFLLTFAFAFGCASPEKKYSKKSTSQLLLRHHQIVEFLRSEKKDFEIKFGPPMFMGDGGRQDRIKEKDEIEVELLRRYEAGDKEAKLP